MKASNDQGNSVLANALNQNLKTVPLTPAPETYLNRLRFVLNEFSTRYPKSDAGLFASSAMGSSRDCKFYISDEKVRRGMAFCVAYNDATTQFKNDNKWLCASVGSMICDVYGAGLRSSVEAALNGIGVRPFVVKLPSQAHAVKIEEAKVPQMDWPSILVYFSCCILILFKKSSDEANYKTFITSCIRDLREIAGCDPRAYLDIPFDFARANAIRTMLGSNSNLRKDLIEFLVSNIHQRETAGIGDVCLYLCNILAWSEMRHFRLINYSLVKPQSPVFLDLRVSREVHNLTVACEAIASHPFPQFYMYLASNVELLRVKPSRFPTLVAVAQELERGDNNGSTAADFELISTVGTNPTTVQALVKLHRSAMPQEKKEAEKGKKEGSNLMGLIALLFAYGVRCLLHVPAFMLK